MSIDLLFCDLQVVGEKEKVDQMVNVRTRDNHVHGMHKLGDVLEILSQEKKQRSLVSLFGDHSADGVAAEEGAQ